MQNAFLVIFTVAALMESVLSETPKPPAIQENKEKMQGEITSLRLASQLAAAGRTEPFTKVELANLRRLHTDLIARYPKEAEPLAVYGEFLLAIDSGEEAFSTWQKALSLDPARHDILAAQADLLLGTGQIVSAADTFEKAAALAPQKAAYPFALAHIYTLFRRDLIASRKLSEDEIFSRGVAYFKLAADLEPTNTSYARAYAESFYTQPKPDWTLARTAWEGLLAQDPESNFIRSHLIRVNIRLKDKNAALGHLELLADPAFETMRTKLQKQIDALPKP